MKSANNSLNRCSRRVILRSTLRALSSIPLSSPTEKRFVTLSELYSNIRYEECGSSLPLERMEYNVSLLRASSEVISVAALNFTDRTNTQMKTDAAMIPVTHLGSPYHPESAETGEDCRYRLPCARWSVENVLFGLASLLKTAFIIALSYESRK